MSADNWSICPKCKATADQKHEERIRAPGQAYGKVSQGEYDRLLAEAKREDNAMVWRNEFAGYHFLKLNPFQVLEFYIASTGHDPRRGFFKQSWRTLLPRYCQSTIGVSVAPIRCPRTEESC